MIFAIAAGVLAAVACIVGAVVVSVLAVALYIGLNVIWEWLVQ